MPLSDLPRLRASFVAMLGALALFATACGGGSDTAVAADSAAPASAESAAPDASADSAPAASSLVASTVAGGQIDFASLEGQDVVLWFWAPW